MSQARGVKKHSLLRRIDAFFTANPGEGLALSDACAKFNCTAEQFALAVKKANQLHGLGLGIENYYRLGVSSRPKKRPKGAPKGPMQPPGGTLSIFSGPPKRVRLAQAAPLNQALLQVRREGGTVVVSRMLEQDTDEWKERERARRARQKPPKPSSGAKTRSKKLVELAGVKDD